MGDGTEMRSALALRPGDSAPAIQEPPKGPRKLQKRRSTVPQSPKRKSAAFTTLEARIASKTQGIKQRCRKSIATARSDTDSAGDATGGLSIFARLPRELRDDIWDLCLSPDKLDHDVEPAHFHVYGDSVYDACTYALRRKRDGKFKWHTTSLLLASRAIYHEAVQSLYRKQPFTVVLCAGHARPKLQLLTRKSLGTPSACQPLFSRMRLVELVIQPGDKPDPETYTAHIDACLATFSHGQHARELKLNFNFGVKAPRALRCDIVRAFSQLGEYYTARPDLTTPTFTIKTKTSHGPGPSPFPSPGASQNYAKLILHLAHALSATTHFWHLRPPTGHAVDDFDFSCWRDDNTVVTDKHCERRGAWGCYFLVQLDKGTRRLPFPQYTPARAVVLVAAMPVLVVVGVPLCWVVRRGMVRYKVWVKGER